MSWNHALRPDRDPKEFYRLVGMKQHPDRQPGGAVTMHRRDNHDCDTDQNFKRDWIDDRVLEIIWMKRPLIDLAVQPAEHADFRGAQRL